MAEPRARAWWVIAALVLLVAGVAAAISYNVGLSQGMAQVPVPAGSVLPYEYGWHRPWGFGLLIPLAFFAFWILMMRGLFWRPWGPRHYGPSYQDRFDEWHRRAHERMGGTVEAPHDRR
jgi:hypothetical protein